MYACISARPLTLCRHLLLDSDWTRAACRATLANSFGDAVSFLAPRKCLHIWPDLFLSLSLVLTGRRRGARDTTQSIHTARWSRLDWTTDRLRTVARRLHARNVCIGALRLSRQLSRASRASRNLSIRIIRIECHAEMVTLENWQTLFLCLVNFNRSPI
jgi:hypothetical protein